MPAQAGSGASGGRLDRALATCPADQHKAKFRSFKGGFAMEAINTMFTNLINTGLNMAMGIGIFFFMVGGVIFMTAAGSTKQMETGKRAMLNAIFGLGLVLSARLIATFLQNALPH
jgi:hypothetical protein